MDENRVTAAEKKSTSETREARIRHWLEQNDALDIAAAAGSLLYGSGIDDSMQGKKKFHFYCLLKL